MSHSFDDWVEPSIVGHHYYYQEEDGRVSKIEWTDKTWNPIRGCSRVSEGCRNCYAERMAARFRGPGMLYHGLVKTHPSGEPRWTGEVRLIKDKLEEPLRWRKPRMVFVNSMSDLFHPDVPDEWIDRIFAVMALASESTFQVLTKRPKRTRDYLAAAARRVYSEIGQTARKFDDPSRGRHLIERASVGGYYRATWPLSNVWLGVSVEDQKTADERIPLLLQTPSAVRFVSCEPLLGPVSLTDRPWWDWRYSYDFYPYGMFRRPIDWVIVGGESGPGARPMNPDWVRSIRDQCIEAGVPFFFKQWGAFAPRGEEDGTPIMERVGKKKAGRVLDGRTWDEMPGEKVTLPDE